MADGDFSLLLDEDERFIADAATRLAADKAPAARLRDLRAPDHAHGYDPALYGELAELGWPGLVIPEAHGGAGLGFFALAAVLEAMGGELMTEPVLTAALGGALLLDAGTEAQRAAWLPRVAAGEALVTLAWQEPAGRYDPAALATRAARTDTGWTLTGEKIQVLDGHVADAFVVSAATDDGPTLFLVPADAPGLETVRQRLLDYRGAALLRLADVPVDDGAVLGEVGQGLAPLGRALDRAAIGTAAEMLGAAERAFALTLDYLKVRVQFGQPIGAFQALQHRAARLFTQLALGRSAVLAAARAVDEAPDEVPVLASLAKAKMGEVFRKVAAEAVQMHGGIGVTDEHDIGFYFKRACAADVAFGDAGYHRDRWARLHGY